MLHLGEYAAIGTAMCWTGSSLFFGLASRRIGGLPVNQFRILLAVPLLALLHLLAAGAVWPALPTDRLLQLGASGIVGLVLGDMGYFYALAVIGPRIGSVLMATWPAMALLLAWATLGETPVSVELLGMLITGLGVMLVLLRGREGSAWNADLTPLRRTLAILGALLGALGMAGGFALARPAMQPGPDLPDGVSGIAATQVRMTAACLGIFLVALLRRQGAAFLAVPRDRLALRHTLIGMLFGPLLGVWLCMIAVRHAESTGTAAALMATTPIWMMPVSRLVYGARIGWVGLLGTLVTVAGAVLLLAQG